MNPILFLFCRHKLSVLSGHGENERNEEIQQQRERNVDITNGPKNDPKL